MFLLKEECVIVSSHSKYVEISTTQSDCIVAHQPLTIVFCGLQLLADPSSLYALIRPRKPVWTMPASSRDGSSSSSTRVLQLGHRLDLDPCYSLLHPRLDAGVPRFSLGAVRFDTASHSRPTAPHIGYYDLAAAWEYLSKHISTPVLRTITPGQLEHHMLHSSKDSESSLQEQQSNLLDLVKALTLTRPSPASWTFAPLPVWKQKIEGNNNKGFIYDVQLTLVKRRLPGRRCITQLRP